MTFDIFSEWAIFALAVLAPIISFASASWGLTRETTAKDDSGTKKLTRDGMVAIAISTGSAVIAVVSIGMNQLVQKQKEANEIDRSALAEKQRLAGIFQTEQREREDAQWKKMDAQQAKVNRDLQIAVTNARAADVKRNQAYLADVQRRLSMAIDRSSRGFISGQTQLAMGVIKPDSVALKVSLDCRNGRGKPPAFANLLGKNPTVSLRIQSRNLADRDRSTDNMFSDFSLLSYEDSDEFVSQKSVVDAIFKEDSDGFGEISISAEFTDFVGDYGRLYNPENWKHAALGFAVGSQLDQSIDQLHAANIRIFDHEFDLTGVFKDGYHERSARVQVGACFVFATISINGRVVKVVSGNFVSRSLFDDNDMWIAFPTVTFEPADFGSVQ